jgi:hypothetical protein
MFSTGFEGQAANELFQIVYFSLRAGIQNFLGFALFFRRVWATKFFFLMPTDWMNQKPPKRHKSQAMSWVITLGLLSLPCFLYSRLAQEQRNNLVLAVEYDEVLEQAAVVQPDFEIPEVYSDLASVFEGRIAVRLRTVSCLSRCLCSACVFVFCCCFLAKHLMVPLPDFSEPEFPLSSIAGSRCIRDSFGVTSLPNDQKLFWQLLKLFLRSKIIFPPLLHSLINCQVSSVVL